MSEHIGNTTDPPAAAGDLQVTEPKLSIQNERKPTLMSLPEHIQVEILSNLNFSDQYFSASKVCKKWQHFVFTSKTLRKKRYPGFFYSDHKDKVFTAHGVFNPDGWVALRALVENGEITAYFYARPQHNWDGDGEDGHFSDDCKYLPPLTWDEADKDGNPLMGVIGAQVHILDQVDISGCPFLDELALSYIPTGYNTTIPKPKKDAKQSRGNKATLVKADNDAGASDSESDSDYEPDSEDDTDGENSVTTSDAEPDDDVNNDSETGLECCCGIDQQLRACVYFEGPCHACFERFRFDIPDLDITGRTVRGAMELSRDWVEKILDQGFRSFAEIPKEARYAIEIRFLEPADFIKDPELLFGTFDSDDGDEFDLEGSVSNGEIISE